MSKFRKKPVVIEAIRFTGAFSWDEMREGSFSEEVIIISEDGKVEEPAPPIHEVAAFNSQSNELYIRTLEGDMRAESGDWIIRGINGEFYPCKPDIFKATYEPVGASEPETNDHPDVEALSRRFLMLQTPENNPEISQLHYLLHESWRHEENYTALRQLARGELTCARTTLHTLITTLQVISFRLDAVVAEEASVPSA